MGRMLAVPCFLRIKLEEGYQRCLGEDQVLRMLQHHNVCLKELSELESRVLVIESNPFPDVHQSVVSAA